MGHHKIHPTVWISIGLLALGVLFAISSTLTPHWRYGNGVSEGLYFYCVDGECHQLEDLPYGDEGWWRFVQITMPMNTASGGLALGFALMFLYQYYKKQTINEKLPDLCFGLAITSGVMMSLLHLAYRMGVFRKDKGMELGYSAHVLYAILPLWIVGGIMFRKQGKCMLSNGDSSNCGTGDNCM